MEYCLVIKKKCEVLIDSTAWMNLENIKSKRGQTQKKHIF